MKEAPLRMCVACRQMKSKDELIRVVKNGGNIALDASFKAAGRGAYVCLDSECIKKLVGRRLLNKAFKCEVPDEIYSAIGEKINE